MVYFPKIEKLNMKERTQKICTRFDTITQKNNYGKDYERTFTICCSILAHYDTRRFRSFGKAVNKRSWLGESPMETAKRVIAF